MVPWPGTKIQSKVDWLGGLSGWLSFTAWMLKLLAVIICEYHIINQSIKWTVEWNLLQCFGGETLYNRRTDKALGELFTVPIDVQWEPMGRCLWHLKAVNGMSQTAQWPRYFAEVVRLSRGWRVPAMLRRFFDSHLLRDPANPKKLVLTTTPTTMDGRCFGDTPEIKKCGDEPQKQEPVELIETETL